MNGCLVEVSLMSGGHPQFCYHVPKACTKTLSLQVALPPLLNGNSYYFRLFGNGRQKRFNFEFDPIKVSEDDCRDKCRHLKPTDCLCNKSSPENGQQAYRMGQTRRQTYRRTDRQMDGQKTAWLSG